MAAESAETCAAADDDELAADEKFDVADILFAAAVRSFEIFACNFASPL